ncbi:hypothetical protein C730_03820 [Helicobacter pylori Rif2]|uniref:Uncharacterized protein n=2 Tax=Helicobacter pylori TaxID=210 RepID=K7YA79_HELPX|nr:hypothetical protein HPSH417_03575 [Helicobacter pylori Shi417]AFH99455.1 hypothetical protein HPSH169_03805 [Helicobacter pylori Shi169]AFI00871.1 hypothetical protein HPSH112_03295 [Helicobacter pylori Shi112]AFV41955.1 hypothetical protein C694_03810 [Helicobacter pylori 26695]AFV43548.1 hypothetical protein C695_03815 [Helicobacter pylori Rif1]AFV45142.1 hypothetical protein C730_03820 [Helicobacter pylori Rif2]AFX89983.1 hypothetical protein HPAKL86_04920 [Helicobacter pylori Aklavik8
MKTNAFSLGALQLILIHFRECKR